MSLLYPPIIIKLNNTYYAALTALAFLLFAVPGFLVFFGFGAPRPKAESAMTHFYIGGLLSAAAVVVLAILIRYRHRLASTTISVDGISSSLYFPSGFIPWDAVEAVRVVRLKGTHICLDIDRSVILQRYSKLNAVLGLGSLNFSTFGSGFAFDDVKKLVDRLVDEARERR